MKKNQTLVSLCSYERTKPVKERSRVGPSERSLKKVHRAGEQYFVAPHGYSRVRFTA